MLLTFFYKSYLCYLGLYLGIGTFPVVSFNGLQGLTWAEPNFFKF